MLGIVLKAFHISGFLSLGAWYLASGNSLLGRGDALCVCKMLNSISDIYPLDPIATAPPHQVVTTKNVSRHCHMSPRGQNPPIENH